MFNASFSLFFSTKAVTTFMSLIKYGKTCEQDVKKRLRLEANSGTERKKRKSKSQDTGPTSKIKVCLSRWESVNSKKQ